jgi:hypothetical protein
MCWGAVNRGVAVYNGKIYASLITGRLVALNAETGKLVWSEQTTDPSSDLTITSSAVAEKESRLAKGLLDWRARRWSPGIGCIWNPVASLLEPSTFVLEWCVALRTKLQIAAC